MNSRSDSSSGKRKLPELPREPIHSLTRPIRRFMHIEATSGIVLLLATCSALAMANSPFAEGYHQFWHTAVGVQVGSWSISHSLEEWINDGLMVLFFFVIGLEVKREITTGELQQPRQAVLPIVAAIGGMIVPAAIYLAALSGKEGTHGWGIPMATDIAFVVGCLAILGRRAPHGLRALLLTLAIVDDLGAILVIAFGYSSGINLVAIGCAAVLLGAIHLLARLGVRSFLPYIGLGLMVWFAFLVSGVHATLAGVILGLMTPSKNYIGPEFFREFLEDAQELIRGPGWQDDVQGAEKTHLLRRATRETVSPLSFLQAQIHPWVSFVVMPLFALANAGITLHGDDIMAAVSWATAVGLLIGKPVGVLLACWLAIGSRIARLPEGVTWRILAGGACLSGIGFTMALFIAGLALKSPLLEHAKVGVLAGSLASAVLGFAILITAPAAAKSTDGSEEAHQPEAT